MENILSDVKQNNWPEELFNTLQVQQNPGWPDEFGVQLQRWIHNTKFKKIPTLSLFSGGGGLDIAFSDAGFDIIEHVEFDSRFSPTLCNNFNDKGAVKCIDIRDYEPEENLKVDVIIGGPPCQTFSAAGRRASGVKGTSDPRGTLFEEYVRLLKKLQPKVFLFENVAGIIGAEGGRAWESIITAFENAGYSIYWRVLDSADYGVPQHRERVFIVGLKSGNFQFPYPTHGPDIDKPYYTAEEALNNVELELEPDKLKISGRWSKLIPGIPPGLNYSYYTAKMGYPRPVFAWRSKFSDFMYKADPKTPVRTIKAQGGQYTGPFSWKSRHFDVAELKRLQSFPDSYVISGSRNVQIHQIGNSVPPQMGRILALAVLDQVFNHSPCKIEYLHENDALSFRKRKRELTEKYKKKAEIAISKLDLKAHEDLIDLPTEQDFCLFPDFSLIEGSSNDGINFNVHYEITEEKALISANFPDTSKKHSFSILIEPKNLSVWPMPFDSIVLKGHGEAIEHVTALWKVLERLLQKVFEIDDLVQLSGYYQYKPAVKAKITTKNSSNLWKVLKEILSYQGVGMPITEQMLSKLWDIPSDGIEDIMIQLRTAGYEIRNHRTNDQIPEGEYLIPYFFPSLNPRSLQRFKSL